METINQATEAVKNTIWGTTSGQTQGTHSDIHRSMIDDQVTERKYSGRTESDPDADGAYQPPNQDTDRKPAAPLSSGGQLQGSNVTGDIGHTRGAFSNSNEPNTGFGGLGAQPSVDADPSSGQGIIDKHQGSGKPAIDPEDSSTFSGQSGSSSDSNISGTPGGGIGGMKLPDSENKSKGEGTGQLYEKSTGMACEGGDFDATRPGAGREAARLLDEQGVQRGDKTAPEQSQNEKKWYGVDHSGFGGHGSHQNKRPSVSDPSEDVDNRIDNRIDNRTDDRNERSASDDVEKRGLAQKIKDKLHVSSS